MCPTRPRGPGALDPLKVSRKIQQCLLSPQDCASEAYPGVCSPRAPGSRGSGSTWQSATWRGRKRPRPIMDEKQLMRLRKQADKNVEKKTHRHAQVPKAPGLPV